MVNSAMGFSDAAKIEKFAATLSASNRSILGRGGGNADSE
jgi:hypothetical protein